MSECPECGRIYGYHKMGCSRRPGRGAVVSATSSATAPDIDLTEAARAIRGAQAASVEDQDRLMRWWDEGLTSPEDVEICMRLAGAALPHIERQVREQVAQELRLMRRRVRDGRMPAGAERDGYLIALNDAARRIARGES